MTFVKFSMSSNTYANEFFSLHIVTIEKLNLATDRAAIIMCTAVFMNFIPNLFPINVHVRNIIFLASYVRHLTDCKEEIAKKKRIIEWCIIMVVFIMIY